MIVINYLLNYSNILLFTINLLILIIYFIIRIKNKFNDKLLVNTENFINKNLNYLVSIFANIRAGKTSTVNGIVHIKERQLYEQCLNEMLDIISFLPSVDFYTLNKTLDAICVSDDIFYSKWNKMTLDAFKLCNIRDGVINDFINCKSIYEIIHKYIECYYIVMYRGIYVYSKNWRYSFFSNMHSRFLSDETLSIKETINNKEFYIRNYSIVIEDELSLSRGKIKSNSTKAKDTGKKELKALWVISLKKLYIIFL